MSGSHFFEASQLKNNLRVISEHIPDARSVSLGFWIGSGTRDEPDDKNGIGHFLEHLIFKGTPRRSAKDIAETFDAIGGELNAFSAKEYTCVYAKVLDEHLPLAVDVISDMIDHSDFKPRDITAERKVVLEEIQMHEDSPSDLVFDYLDQELFLKHPLSRRILGSFSSIRSIRRNDILSFYADHYSASNIVVAAAGNLRHDNLSNLVKRHFKGRSGPRITKTGSSRDTKTRVKIVEKPIQQSHICYGMEGLAIDHPDRFALAVIDTILGGGMSSRLFQDVRERRGLVYSIYSFHSQFQDTGVMGVYAGTTPAQTKKVVDLISKEIYDIADKGASDTEIQRAKEHIKGSMILGFEDNTTRMTRLGKAATYQTEILSIDELVEKVNNVSANEVKRVAREIFLRPKILTIVSPDGEVKAEDFDLIRKGV